MKVALVYDRVNKWGGAERVLLALRQLYPEAPLYTSVYNRKKASWANDFTIKTSFLQQFPHATSSHELYAPLMPLAFESFSFDKYDLVISVTSEAAKGIITKPSTKHICYCLTPTRYLWSGYQEYFSNPVLRLSSYPVTRYLQTWDLVAAQRPDAYISISHEVQQRVKKFYHRDSNVIYPPLMLSSEPIKNRVEESDFFLVVSRLVPYKRVDLAIKACNSLKLPLIIIGTGSEEFKLKKIAGPTIRFLGALTDEELLPYYNQCRALLFPGNEDFGLTMAEAQSFGKPVIAYKAGGALEIVEESISGIFFGEQNTASLVDAIEKFQEVVFDEEKIKKQAERFQVQRFKKLFHSEVERILAMQDSL